MVASLPLPQLVRLSASSRQMQHVVQSSAHLALERVDLKQVGHCQGLDRCEHDPISAMGWPVCVHGLQQLVHWPTSPSGTSLVLQAAAHQHAFTPGWGPPHAVLVVTGLRPMNQD